MSTMADDLATRPDIVVAAALSGYLESHHGVNFDGALHQVQRLAPKVWRAYVEWRIVQERTSGKNFNDAVTELARAHEVHAGDHLAEWRTTMPTKDASRLLAEAIDLYIAEHALKPGSLKSQEVARKALKVSNPELFEAYRQFSEAQRVRIGRDT